MNFMNELLRVKSNSCIISQECSYKNNKSSICYFCSIFRVLKRIYLWWAYKPVNKKCSANKPSLFASNPRCLWTVHFKNECIVHKFRLQDKFLKLSLTSLCGDQNLRWYVDIIYTLMTLASEGVSGDDGEVAANSSSHSHDVRSGDLASGAVWPGDIFCTL